MNEATEHLWGELKKIICAHYGVHGHFDPGGAQLYYIAKNGSRQELCRTSEMAGSAEDDFNTICKAIVEKDLETFGIATTKER